MKKTTGDIIILYKRTINDNHMIYGFWDKKWSATDIIFLSSWAIFCPFTPLTARKMTISHKRKKSLDISSFYINVPKIMIIRYTVPGIWHVTDVIVIFQFRLYFSLLPPPSPAPPNSPKNENFRKMKKNSWRYHQFNVSVPKIIIICFTVPEIWPVMDCYFSFWAILSPLTP